MRETAKHVWFNKIPKPVRKSIVLVVGSIFLIAAAATGWLPGPGGIPLFLIGIAILATEFAWAERFRDRMLEAIHYLGKQWRAHKIIGTIIFICCVAVGLSLAIYSFSKL